jgi:regulator of replication initiation timing
MMRVSQYVFRVLNYSCFMLLTKFLFHVQIIELENRLSQLENELRTMKEEVAVAKKEPRNKEDATKKQEVAKRLKETTKNMVARWWKDGGQVCSRNAHLKM